MPHRTLREGILQSEAVNALSWDEEVFYRRLMSVVDDFGRFSANPKLLRSACYPLLLDKVGDADVGKWISVCRKAALISLFTSADGKECLEVAKFGQQLRTKTKYPKVGELDQDCLADAKQVLSSCVQGPLSHVCTSSSEFKNKEKEATAAVVSAWNQQETLPKIRHLSPDRARLLAVRLKDSFFIENFRETIEKIGKSDFCLGGGSTGWKATFDWLLQPGTVAKVMEGKYDNRNGSKATEALNSKEITDLLAEFKTANPKRKTEIQSRLKTLRGGK